MHIVVHYDSAAKTGVSVYAHRDDLKQLAERIHDLALAEEGDLGDGHTLCIEDPECYSPEIGRLSITAVKDTRSIIPRPTLWNRSLGIIVETTKIAIGLLAIYGMHKMIT